MTKEEAEEREAAESERVASKELNEVEELLRQCKERVAIQQAARSDEEKQHEETLTILVSNIDETRREILETGRVQLEERRLQRDRKEEESNRRAEMSRAARRVHFVDIELKHDLEFKSKKLERAEKRAKRARLENMKLAEELLRMTKIKMVEVQANINNENEQLEALQSVQKALETERDEKENELNLCKEALTILPLAQQVQSWGKKKMNSC